MIRAFELVHGGIGQDQALGVGKEEFLDIGQELLVGEDWVAEQRFGAMPFGLNAAEQAPEDGQEDERALERHRKTSTCLFSRTIL